MNDGARCTRCGEELSEYSACACAFAPHYPRAASSSATSAPASMRGLLAQRDGCAARTWDTLTTAQRGTLARLALGPTHVHGATASRLLAFGYVRIHTPSTPCSYRAVYEITTEGLEAHRAIRRVLEADRTSP